MRQDLNLQGPEACPGSDRVPSASRIVHPSRSGAESDLQGTFRALACFRGRCRRQSASRSRAESERFELPRRSSRLTRFPDVPLVPSGHSPLRGRRADRTPAGLMPRPPVSNRVPYHSASLPMCPRRKCAPGGIRTLTPHGHGHLRPARLPIPPPGLGVAGEI